MLGLKLNHVSKRGPEDGIQNDRRDDIKSQGTSSVIKSSLASEIIIITAIWERAC